MVMFQQEGSDLMTQWLGNVQGNLIWRIVGALALLLFAHIIIRFVVNRVDHLLERSKMDSTVHLFLVRLTSYSLYALLIVTIL
jgi:hypothetical protein